MKKTLINLAPILLILLVTISGLIAYFTMLSPNNSIIIKSFDGQSSICFGELEGLDLDEVKTSIGFNVIDAEAFANEVFLTHENFEYTAQDNNYKYYIFNKDGYYYYAFYGFLSNSRIYIENLVSLQNVHEFPFFSTTLIIGSFTENESSYTWEELNKIKYLYLTEQQYTSYEDVKAFYSKVNQIYWTSDDETKTIQLTGYQKFGSSSDSDRINDTYFITLVCSNDGIIVTYEDPM